MPEKTVVSIVPPVFTPPPFLDVSTLLESSRPVRRLSWISYVAGSFLVLTVIETLVGPGGSSASPLYKAMQAGTAIMVLPVLGLAVYSTVAGVRKFRREQAMLESIEEMIQLRRWEPAAMLLTRFMSLPARTVGLWAQALVDLATLLGRHHRFDDAMLVESFLIENELLDDQSDFFVRLARTMAMLRQDHLVDADRAINDLRRRDPDRASGGLALVEIYRDVKTGHPDEAVELFAKRLPQMRQQLGHRVADAHALVARAHDSLGQEAEAKAAYERATLLAPPSELQRRYPELVKLAEKYQPALAPAEAV